MQSSEAVGLETIPVTHKVGSWKECPSLRHRGLGFKAESHSYLPHSHCLQSVFSVVFDLPSSYSEWIANICSSLKTDLLDEATWQHGVYLSLWTPKPPGRHARLASVLASILDFGRILAVLEPYFCVCVHVMGLWTHAPRECSKVREWLYEVGSRLHVYVSSVNQSQDTRFIRQAPLPSGPFTSPRLNILSGMFEI